MCDETTALLLVMGQGGLAFGSILLSSRYVTSATDGSHEARFHLHFQDSLITTSTVDFAHLTSPELRCNVIKKCSELWQTVVACELYGISVGWAIHTRDSKTLDVTNAAPSRQVQLVTHHNETRFSWLPAFTHKREFPRPSRRNSSCASHNKRPSAAKMRSLRLIAGDVEEVNVGTC